MAKGSQKRLAGPLESEIDKDEKKKIRNRLSQRAFRRRQAEHLRDLQRHVKANNQPDNERIAVLEQENSRLRAHVTQIQSQLEGFQASFQLMTKACSNVLGGNTPLLNVEDETRQRDKAKAKDLVDQTNNVTRHYSDEAREDQPEPQTPIFSRSHEGEEAIEIEQTRDRCDHDSSLVSYDPPYDSSFQMTLQDPITEHSGLDSVTFKSPLDLQQIPNVWSFDFQMGSQSYMDAMESCQPLGFVNGLGWSNSNSPFSDHIRILKQLLSSKLGHPSLVDTEVCRTVYQFISNVLAMFNSVSRPDVMNWYAETKFYHIVELTAWQILPSPVTFSKLHQRYGPTDLQISLQGQYPCLVDWILFPSIRDRIIQLHAANSYVDQIFCDAVSAYVQILLDTSIRYLLDGVEAMQRQQASSAA